MKVIDHKLIFSTAALLIVVSLISFMYPKGGVTGNVVGGAIAAATTSEQAWLGIISLVSIIALAVIVVIAFQKLSKKK